MPQQVPRSDLFDRHSGVRSSPPSSTVWNMSPELPVESRDRRPSPFATERVEFGRNAGLASFPAARAPAITTEARLASLESANLRTAQTLATNFQAARAVASPAEKRNTAPASSPPETLRLQVEAAKARTAEDALAEAVATLARERALVASSQEAAAKAEADAQVARNASEAARSEILRANALAREAQQKADDACRDAEAARAMKAREHRREAREAVPAQHYSAEEDDTEKCKQMLEDDRTAKPPREAEEPTRYQLDAGVFELKFADLSKFFDGLDGLIGGCDKNVEKAIEHEHTTFSDSHSPFRTTNYGILTTSHTEYWFVKDYKQLEGKVLIPKETVTEALKKSGKPREPKALADFEKARAKVNQELSLVMKQKESEAAENLKEEPFQSSHEFSPVELLACRLYTGPMFTKRVEPSHTRALHEPAHPRLCPCSSMRGSV